MPRSRHIRTVIADDHPMVREGMISFLKRSTNLAIVAEADSWTNAIKITDQHSPDLAMLDVRMPGMEATEGVARLKQQHPALQIILISAFDCDEDICGAIRAGADGFMMKNFTQQEMVRCIRSVLDGKRWLPAGPAAMLLETMNRPQLTRRQIEILSAVAEGKTNKEVGAALGITEGTVKLQLHRIFRRMGVSNRTEAITRGVARRLVRLKSRQ